jgi:hypothetical protein
LSSVSIEVGVSGEQTPSSKLKCWETQSHGPWRGTKILLVRVPHPRQWSKRWSEWGESCAEQWREIAPHSITFRVPPSLSGLFTEREAREVLRGGDSRDLEFWIDDPEPSRSIDPMMRRDPRSSHWKIHGWHPERWRQRYSSEELRELAVRARRLRPRTIVFAHPTRAEQSLEFVRLMEEMG